MLAEIVDRVVVVGGPGEGKSTVGQYLAQLHRATLLTRVDKIALSPQYYPEFPRIPIRVILKDYGQWLATASSSEPSSASLDKYICEQIEAATSRPIDTLSLHKLISDNPTLLILDGLDEVTDTSLKKLLVERLAEFTERCKEALKANLQILATTRPTGYTEQFDPRKYLHLSLLKLEPKQVREYIGGGIKWSMHHHYFSAALRVSPPAFSIRAFPVAAHWAYRRSRPSQVDSTGKGRFLSESIGGAGRWCSRCYRAATASAGRRRTPECRWLR